MKISLAFSGGGYRASSFNLGAISYLDKVSVNGQSLLSQVIALSTVSGGTITGGRYAIGIKRGETMKEIYTSLYRFFMETDLVLDSINHLKADEGWSKKRVKSLINAFADLYDAHLFDREKFGLLLSEDNPIHLKHISFNATEFTTGLQFRFQISERINPNGRGRTNNCLIGNFYNNIPESYAREIRMADILASSSCFPGGFEPINFPDDFVLPSESDIHEFLKNEKFPIGLMDGGIVDNQGIEPLLLAEKRMKTENPDCESCVTDLIIVSDVSSPYMEGFTASEEQKENWWRSLTLTKIRNISAVALLLSAAALIAGIFYHSILTAIISTFTLTLSTLIVSVIVFSGKQLKNVQIIDTGKLKNILDVKLLVFESFIKNRVKSVMKLTGSVFMKHIRRLNFRSIYDRDEWENRRIMNAIYQLRPGEKKTEEKFRNGLSEYLRPSTAVAEAARKAASMGTTLWFKEGKEGQEMLDTIIACGQFNICWNLLEYIERLKKSDTNTNESHKELMSCEPQLRQDWEKFQKDPYWLVKVYNGNG